MNYGSWRVVLYVTFQAILRAVSFLTAFQALLLKEAPVEAQLPSFGARSPSPACPGPRIHPVIASLDEPGIGRLPKCELVTDVDWVTVRFSPHWQARRKSNE